MFKHFIVTTSNLDKETTELNNFLRTNKIISVKPYFENSTFYYQVEYSETPKIESKKEITLSKKFDELNLSAEETKIFKTLKLCRSIIAKSYNEKHYNIFRDIDMKDLIYNEMTPENVINANTDKKSSIKKYAEDFVKLYNIVKNVDISTKYLYKIYNNHDIKFYFDNENALELIQNEISEKNNKSSNNSETNNLTLEEIKNKSENILENSNIFPA